MKILGIFILIFICISFLSGDSLLKLDKFIGDERDEYCFFRIYDAIASQQGDYYIADGKGHFVAKYDKMGKFVKRVGRKGQGTGDFYYPRSLYINNKNIYLYDNGNARFVELDLNLNIKRYFKLGITDVKRFEGNVFVLGKNRYIGNLSSITDLMGTLSIIDEKGKFLKKVFNRFPIKIKKDFQPQSSNAFVGLKGAAKKPFAIDKSNKEIFVTFKRPDNPIKFFVSDFEGNIKKEFLYSLDEKYKFPNYSLKTHPKIPKKSHEFLIESVFMHKGFFLALLVKYERNLRKVNNISYSLLVFNSNGELFSRERLNEKYRFFSITPSGHLLGKSFDSEIEQLLIFKINL